MEGASLVAYRAVVPDAARLSDAARPGDAVLPREGRRRVKGAAG